MSLPYIIFYLSYFLDGGWAIITKKGQQGVEER